MYTVPVQRTGSCTVSAAFKSCYGAGTGYHNIIPGLGKHEQYNTDTEYSTVCDKERNSDNIIVI